MTGTIFNPKPLELKLIQIDAVKIYILRRDSGHRVQVS